MFYLLAYIIRGGINRHRQKDQNFHCNKELFHAPNKINIDKEQKKTVQSSTSSTHKNKKAKTHPHSQPVSAPPGKTRSSAPDGAPPHSTGTPAGTPPDSADRLFAKTAANPSNYLQKKKKTATETTRSSDPIANNTIKKPNQSNSEATEHKSKAYQDNTGPWRTQRRPPSRPRRRRRGRRRRRRVLPRPSPPTRRRSAEAAAWRGDAKKNGAFLGGHGYMRSRHFNDGRSCQRDAHVRFGSGGSKPR